MKTCVERYTSMDFRKQPLVFRSIYEWCSWNHILRFWEASVEAWLAASPRRLAEDGTAQTPGGDPLGTLRLTNVRLTPEMVRENERMLTGRFCAEVTLGYDASIGQEKDGRQFGVEALRAIQLSKRETVVVKAQNQTLTTK